MHVSCQLDTVNKQRKDSKKALVKGRKIFLKMKTTKSVSIFMNYIEIFLKKRKSTQMLNNTKVFLNMKSKG